MRYLLLILFFNASVKMLFGQNPNTVANEVEFRNYIYYCLDSLNQLEHEQYLRIKSIKVYFTKKGKIKQYYLSSGKEYISFKKKNYKLILALLNKKDYFTYLKALQSNFESDKNNQYLVKMHFTLIGNREK